MVSFFFSTFRITLTDSYISIKLYPFKAKNISYSEIEDFQIKELNPLICQFVGIKGLWIKGLKGYKHYIISGSRGLSIKLKNGQSLFFTSSDLRLYTKG